MLSKEKIKSSIKHPNFFTLCRVAAIPVIVIIMHFPNKLFSFIAAVLFSAAAITDFLDGFLARNNGLESVLGKIMDPVADKLLVSCTLIMLCFNGWIPAWIVCIIIGREIAVTGLRNIIAGKSEDVSASKLGKYKTGFQIAAIIPLLIHYPYFEVDFNVIGLIFLWIALFLTIWSGIDYFVRFRKLIIK